MAARKTFPPDLEDRFDPHRVLGEGAMGAVWLAKDRGLDRLVAIKVLKGARPGSSVAARMVREAEIMARLRHPRVLALYSAGECSAGPYLVAEYLAGQDLLATGLPFDPLATMLEAGEGLEAAHRAGVLHRDLKPNNIVLVEGRGPVLIDFGLADADAVATLTATGQWLGSLGYLAPERFLGGPATPQADWYAWGVSLYQLLEEKLPFDREGFEALAMGRPLPVPVFTRADPAGEAARHCLVAMDPDPDRRPGSLAELRARPAAPGPARPAPAPVARPGPGALPTPTRGAAHPAPAAPPRGGVRPFVLGLAAVLATAGLVLGPGRKPPPSAPGPPLPRAAPDPDAPFDEAFAGEMRTGIRGLTAEQRGDPLRFRDALAGLPPVARFDTWLAAGGRPEGLSPGVRARLVALDQALAGTGLPRVFAPFVEAAPGAGPFAARVGPALEEATRLHGEYEEESAAVIRGREPRSPLRAGFRGLGAGLPLRLTDHLMLAWQEPLRRAEAAAWVRPGTDALLAGLWAARRALDEEPSKAEELVRATGHRIDSLDGLWIETRAFGPPARLLGWPPSTPAGHSLLAAVLRAAIRAEDRVPARDLAAWAALRRALEGAAVEPPAGDGPGRGRYSDAVAELAAWLEEARDFPGLGELYRRHREAMLRVDDSAVADFLAVLLRVWGKDQVPRPSLDEVAALVAWVDAHPGQLGRRKAEEALKADLAKLLEGI